MATPDFIDDTIGHEGGLVDHKNDRGGLTNLGLTLGFLKSIGDDGDLDGDGDVDADDILAADENDARRLYAKHFWKKPRYHLLPEPIQEVMVDMAVNHGAGGATKILQRVLNKAGFGPLAIDGGNGPKTRGAAHHAFQEMGDYMINALVDERVLFFRRIVANDSSQIVFLKGWINRAEKYRVAV